MRFDEPTGTRTSLAMELLSAGQFVNFRGVGLQVDAAGILECRVFSQWEPESVNAVIASEALAVGRATLADLAAASPEFAAFFDRPQLWELLWDYGGGALRLCRLEGGSLVWESGYPKRGAGV